MNQPAPTDAGLPPTCARVLQRAIRDTFRFLEPPDLAAATLLEATTGVGAVIGLIGPPTWTLSLFLPPPGGTGIVRRFLKFEIPYDGPDMQDAVAELADILANRLVTMLSVARIMVARTLPAATRGPAPEETLPGDAERLSLIYQSGEGPFRVTLVACQPPEVCRTPGD